MRALLLPALGLILPITWTLSAVGALQNGRFGGFVARLISASGFVLAAGIAMRSGRKQCSGQPECGELRDRLSALSRKCHVELRDVCVVPVSSGMIVEPFEAENGEVALPDFMVDTFELPEIEAALARRLSMPMRDYPYIRVVLIFLAALLIGALLSVAALLVLALVLAFLEGLVRSRTPIHFGPLAARLAVPLALLCAVPIYGLTERWIVRRADRRAAALMANGELVSRMASKLAAAVLPPWKWAAPKHTT
jgi:hypothetical protein